MNLRKFGMVVATIVTMPLGAFGIGACAFGTAPSEKPRVITQSDLRNDKITDWSDGTVKRDVKRGELGVTTLLEIRPDSPIRPGLREQYFAVGALGDRCMVTYRNFDTEGHTRVEISPRWEGDSFDYHADSSWIGPKEVVKDWVLHRKEYCVTEPV